MVGQEKQKVQFIAHYKWYSTSTNFDLKNNNTKLISRFPKFRVILQWTFSTNAHLAHLANAAHSGHEYQISLVLHTHRITGTYPCKHRRQVFICVFELMPLSLTAKLRFNACYWSVILQWVYDTDTDYSMALECQESRWIKIAMDGGAGASLLLKAEAMAANTQQTSKGT